MKCNSSSAIIGLQNFALQNCAPDIRRIFSFDQKKLITGPCLFQEKINGEKVKFRGEVCCCFDGETRIRVSLDAKNQNSISFDLSVKSKFPVEEDCEYWSLSDWTFKDSLFTKPGSELRDLPYLWLPRRLHKKGGCLVDKLDLEFMITVKFRQLRNSTTVLQSVTTDHMELQSICEDNRQMLLTGRCSDFKIHLPRWGWTKDVHKFVLVSRSPVLGAMIESQMQETVTDRLVLVDTHPAAVNIFLKLLYLGKLEANVDNKDSLMDVFGAAVLCDKFGRPDFVGLCCLICTDLIVDSTSEELVAFLSQSKPFEFATRMRECALNALAPMREDIEDFETMRELLGHMRKCAYNRMSKRRSNESGEEMYEDIRDSRRRRLE